jgi:hypothetical protein
MYWEYYGGNRANPSSGVHGKKGGNAILVNHAVIILNAGIISVGGGGGGASGGGGVSFFSTISFASQCAVPPGPVTVMWYCVVTCGETDCDPESGTEPKTLIVAPVVLVELHESCACSPF